jgi:hypothetical protein
MRSRCSGRQRLEADLEGEAAQRRLVELVEQVGGADEDAGEALHALQHLVDLGDLVVALGQAAAAQEAVGLVEQQHRAFGLRPRRTCGPCSARSRRRTCWRCRWSGDHQRPAAARCARCARPAPSCRCPAGRGSTACRGRAAQRLDDARHLEARLHVQQRQVVCVTTGRARRAPPAPSRCPAPVGGGGSSWRSISASTGCRRGRPRQPCRRQPREAHRGADLRRRQALALGQPAAKPALTGTPASARCTRASRAPGRRALQQQVVLEAAAEGGVDLLDAVGDPDHRHRVGLQDLVDPGLAADAAAGRRRRAVHAGISCAASLLIGGNTSSTSSNSSATRRCPSGTPG